MDKIKVDRSLLFGSLWIGFGYSMARYLAVYKSSLKSYQILMEYVKDTMIGMFGSVIILLNATVVYRLFVWDSEADKDVMFLLGGIMAGSALLPITYRATDNNAPLSRYKYYGDLIKYGMMGIVMSAFPMCLGKMIVKVIPNK